MMDSLGVNAIGKGQNKFLERNVLLELIYEMQLFKTVRHPHSIPKLFFEVYKNVLTAWAWIEPKLAMDQLKLIWNWFWSFSISIS